MKRVKSLIGIAMIAVMVVAMCAFSASAAMTLSVTLDKSQVEVGDTVTATVSVENYETALAGFAVTIEYDKNAWTLTDVAPEAYGDQAVVEPEDPANADGKITIVWFSAQEEITGVSKLADLTFTAKAEATNPEIKVSFAPDGIVLPGETPEIVQPEDGVYSDAEVNAPAIEIVPEGTLGGDEPAEGDTGSANNESSGAAGSSSVDVKGTYKTGDRTNMYKVVVNWGSMVFTYTEADETWNPDDHAWELDDATAVGEWAPAEDGVSNKVALVNHSSQPVTVTLAFADSLAEDTVTGTWSAESLALDAVVGVGNEAAVDEDAATLTLSGKLTDESVKNTVIGTVTATIE